MTRKEWVEKNMPRQLHAQLRGGVWGCPGSPTYRDMPGNEGARICAGIKGDCVACWNTELPITSLREEILMAAREAVCGQRNADYGSVEDNFKLIAALWTAYLGHEIKPVDVAMCMALLKIARVKTGVGTRDSFVDLAGYAACAGEVAKQ